LGFGYGFQVRAQELADPPKLFFDLGIDTRSATQLSGLAHPLQLTQERKHGVHAAHRAGAGGAVGNAFDIGRDAGRDGVPEFGQLLVRLPNVTVCQFPCALGVVARQFCKVIQIDRWEQGRGVRLFVPLTIHCGLIFRGIGPANRRPPRRRGG